MYQQVCPATMFRLKGVTVQVSPVAVTMSQTPWQALGPSDLHRLSHKTFSLLLRAESHNNDQ